MADHFKIGDLEQYLKIYAIYRERVFQEDQIVNHRMGWMLTSNILLFTFYAVLIGKIGSGPTPPKDLSSSYVFAPIWVAGLGTICTAGSMFSINAALQEIEKLKSKYEELKKRLSITYPQIAHAEAHGEIPHSIVGHDTHHAVGKIVPWLIPGSILMLWIGLVAKYLATH
jgi:hypothetical protein